MEQEEYNQKIAEMHEYIPLLQLMIERLQRAEDRDRRQEVALQKFEKIHKILTLRKRSNIETLLQCEDILERLHTKIRKVEE